MKKILVFASVAEALTGLALLIIPSIVGNLLLEEELSGVSLPVAQMLGIALVSLAVACWPKCQAINGMLTYGALVTIYLAYVGIEGMFVGILLWPAVLIHAVLTIALVKVRFQSQKL